MASLSTRVRNYDVFLSFRGEDTRRTIVSYLYEALCREGIITFRDDRRLEAGDNISDQLIEAIKTSWFAVVVISKNYATSKWCLEELRLIMELHSANHILVVPMFYGVAPTDVRNQTGSFAAAFQNFEDLDTAPERVSQWRRALSQVSHLSGFHSTTWLDEAAMVTKTVQSVLSGLLTTRPSSGVDLVGMEAHMVKMHFLLNMGSKNEVLMIGIWGMGGVGKTTIAKCLYERFSSQFPAHYFIEDIKKIYKDKSPSYLQESFLYKITGQHIDFQRVVAGSQVIKARLQHQKVLVVLDGVDKAEQMHALAKETSWFGRGSRIIITTQDRGLLTSCGVNHIHEVKCLEDKDALQVFKKTAFGGRKPPSDEFERLFIRASRLAHGLPSALVAYASHLSENTTIERWEDEIRLLETSPHKNVEEILRNSYDGLDNKDKIAFLYVACLLNGYPFNHVTSLLDDGCPRMNHLSKKSLISISNDFVSLPNDIGNLHKLKYLSLHNCRIIKSLPRLAQVKTLVLSECVNLKSFMTIYPWETYCLLELWLDNCKHVRSLSESLSGFTKLTYIDLSRNNFFALPHSIRKLSSLGTLYLNNCKKLKSVEDLPKSVKYLHAHGCDSLEKVSLSPNHSIEHLDILHCPRLNQEEHKHLMDLFINDGQSQEGSLRCACIRETGGSSNSSNETSEHPRKLARLENYFGLSNQCLGDHYYSFEAK